MTPEEHDELKLRMHALAQNVLLDFLTDFARRRIGLSVGPERARTLDAMRTKLQGARQEYSSIALPGMHAAESDLRTALFQEAFEALSEEVLTTIERGLTAEEYRQMTGQ